MPSNIGILISTDTYIHTIVLISMLTCILQDFGTNVGVLMRIPISVCS
jgi:hypothetical protein